MMRLVGTRLAALEKRLPETKLRKVVRLVVDEGGEAAAIEEARRMGIDPDGDDLLIIRLIAVQPRQSVTAASRF